jgi:hypothetical protein
MSKTKKEVKKLQKKSLSVLELTFWEKKVVILEKKIIHRWFEKKKVELKFVGKTGLINFKLETLEITQRN